LNFYLRAAVIAAISYLLGSVNFACIFTKIFSGKDIRNYGSGNAGMTNVFRSTGAVPGILTFAGDLLKVVVAIWISVSILGHENQGLVVLCRYISGFCCILGHLYPVFFQFRGGKGVVVAAGTMLMVDWRVFLAAAVIFLVSTLASRIVSLSSIIVAVAFPVLTFFFYDPVVDKPGELTQLMSFFYDDQKLLVTLLAALFAAVVVIKHILNIIRILHGEETRIFIKKREG